MIFLQILSIIVLLLGVAYVLTFLICFDIKELKEEGGKSQFYILFIGIGCILIGLIMFEMSLS